MNPQARLANQLLRQAIGLAEQDPKKPLQANLRRAVSSAYYALFHLLVSESTAQIAGTAPDNARLRLALSRAYAHGDMAMVAKWFEGQQLPD